MKKVAIYCSSRADLPEGVNDGAILIAKAIGECGAKLVYGGVNAGLMHTVAQAAAQAGAEIVGVVPEVFAHRADSLCNSVVMASDLNARKGLMIDMADLFVVLPGGLGTIDEWISTLSHIMVQEKVNPNADKPILVWNHNGMYDAQVEQLTLTDQSVYARGKRVDRSRIFASADDLAAALKSILL